MNDLTSRLKASRVEAGLSQGALAEKLKVSSSTISRWERTGSMSMLMVDYWFKACSRLARLVISPESDNLPLEEVCVHCGSDSCSGRNLLLALPELDGTPGTTGLEICYLREVPNSCPFIAEHTILRGSL